MAYQQKPVAYRHAEHRQEAHEGAERNVPAANQRREKATRHRRRQRKEGDQREAPAGEAGLQQQEYADRDRDRNPEHALLGLLPLGVLTE